MKKRKCSRLKLKLNYNLLQMKLMKLKSEMRKQKLKQLAKMRMLNSKRANKMQ